ncbi:hypothetical protein [uncultured Aquimarina sp.]|uniref:hypothetical protein n=1 Tax=uncultured Aquimarina sp. TaxID=575652 RepID=UPI002602B232|nr:hypothetical protein [uncultured Aquimarina sp.]
MKKIIFLLMISAGIVSCENESNDFVDQETSNDLSIQKEKEIFSFDNWEEFRKSYLKFAKLSTEELEGVSFLTSHYDEEMEISYALQGILNKDNQFRLADKIIWFDQGNFYEFESDEEIATQKLNIENLKEVGSVSQIPVSLSEDTSLAKTVPISNQYQFRKQSYIENCGTGITQGPSPRAFKYVHEAFAELIVSGSPFYQVYQYALHLRVKLEYNHRGNSWRLSGEGRDISINLTNTSFLTNQLGSNLSTGIGATNYRTIRFSNSCASHQQELLNEVRAPGLIPNSFWNINVSGTITQKMFGDTESNRWRDTVNW